MQLYKFTCMLKEESQRRESAHGNLFCIRRSIGEDEQHEIMPAQMWRRRDSEGGEEGA